MACGCRKRDTKKIKERHLKLIEFEKKLILKVIEKQSENNRK